MKNEKEYSTIDLMLDIQKISDDLKQLLKHHQLQNFNYLPFVNFEIEFRDSAEFQMGIFRD